jgi:hypothetical protein
MSINCQWMKQAIGYHHQQHQHPQQQQMCLPRNLTLSNETIGCLKGPIVRCMQTTEFVHVSQINACALAITCLFKSQDPSTSDYAATQLAQPPPTLSTTAAVFHRFGIPGKLFKLKPLLNQ